MQRRLEGIDSVLADIAKQARASLPEVLTAFAREALVDVRQRWPERTGRSAAALDVRVDGGRIAIVCDVPYASYIHEKGLRGPTWMVRIVEYVQRNADAIGARAVRRLRGV